jgi:hypothetical protein
MCCINPNMFKNSNDNTKKQEFEGCTKTGRTKMNSSLFLIVGILALAIVVSFLR